MTESILEKADAQIAASIHRLSRSSTAIADAIDESADVIRRAVKRSGDIAEELMDDTTQRVKRHPVETIAITFGTGLLAGALAGWLITRK